MSGSKVTQPRILSGTTEKVAIWLRERYGVTGEIPWQEESTAIRNRWCEDAEELLQHFGISHTTKNLDDISQVGTFTESATVVPPKPARSAVGTTSRHRMGSGREPGETDEEYEAYVNPHGL